MSDKRKEGLLGRWSRLKRESNTGSEGDGPMPARRETEPATAGRAKSATIGHADKSALANVTPDSKDGRPTADSLPELPSIEELNPDSDFEAFMDPRVDDDMRRAALKTLFRDPDFNVTDGLDVYAEDYTKLEKLTPAMVAALKYAQRTLFAKNDESEAEHGGAEDAPVELASNETGNEPLRSSEAEAEQSPSEAPQTQDSRS